MSSILEVDVKHKKLSETISSFSLSKKPHPKTNKAIAYTSLSEIVLKRSLANHIVIF